MNEAERRVQLAFIKSLIFNAIFVAVPTFAFQHWLMTQRPGVDLAPSRVAVTFLAEPVAGPPCAGCRLRAWTIFAGDRRVGGLSGLAIEDGRLLALSDSGMVVRMDPPGTAAPTASVVPLPAVPGNPRRKVGRDSEAIAADGAGGWWVAFEQAHLLIRYDAALSREIERRALPTAGFRANRGVEGLVVLGGRPVAFAENSGVADAALLADGRIARLVRRVGPGGFSARIEGLGPPIALPTGALDNAEGIAAAPRPDGGTRLWIVTDNDETPWRRTLLLAVDLPPPAKG